VYDRVSMRDIKAYGCCWPHWDKPSPRNERRYFSACRKNMPMCRTRVSLVCLYLLFSGCGGQALEGLVEGGWLEAGWYHEITRPRVDAFTPCAYSSTLCFFKTFDSILYSNREKT